MRVEQPRVLVLEEQKITGFDLQVKFAKSGFAVMRECDLENLTSMNMERSPFLVIASVGSLLKKNLMTPGENSEYYLKTDTVVFSPGSLPLKKFPKPFNSDDVVNFVSAYLASQN